MAEKEYIERAKAQDGLDNIDWYHVNGNGQLLPGGKSDIETYVPFKAVEEMLKSIHAADVRPVIYCKDCRHRDPEDHKCDCGGMERQGCPFKVADDYFCAYGER